MSNEMKMTNSSSDDEDMETDDEDSASQNSEVPNQEVIIKHNLERAKHWDTLLLNFRYTCQVVLWKRAKS